MKLRLTFFSCLVLLFSAQTWGQTWNLTPTMTATLDSNGVLTISTTASSEAMPDLRDLGTPWYMNSDINSVVIEDGVTTIGNFAFSSCSVLTSVTIPNSVISIGINAFGACSSLTSVEIPNSVKSIEDFAFDNTGLTSVTIPNSVDSIGKYAFGSCSGLTSLEIPNSVKSIGDCAFVVCTGLTSITIPNSVVFIGNQAFQGCTGLDSVSIPNSVTSIGEAAFQGCTALKDVTVNWTTPLSVPDIFNNTNINATLHVPTGTKALYYASPVWGTFRIIDDGIIDDGNQPWNLTPTMTANLDNNGVLTISTTKEAEAMPNYSYRGLGFTTPWYDSPGSIHSVVIENGVTSIGSLAFYNCTNLTSVSIPNSVTSIGATAFNNCTGLTSVTIPNSVVSIGDHAFVICTALTDVTVNWAVPLSVSVLFDGVNTPATLHVPSGTKALYQAAPFWKDFGTIIDDVPLTISVSPTSLNFAASGEQKTFTVTSNTNWTVGSSDSWLTVSPASGSDIGTIKVTAAANTTFDQRTATITVNGTGVTAQTITVTQDAGITWNLTPTMTATLDSDGVLTISTTKVEGEAMPDSDFDFETDHTNFNPSNFISPNWPWNNMSNNIRSIVVENNVTSIGNCAFAGCFKLTSVVIYNSVTTIGRSAFNNCTGLTSVIIPNSVNAIGINAFFNCTGLTSITIPNSVSFIGIWAFCQTGLTSVTIPSSVTAIGDDAFGGCYNMASIQVDPDNPVYSSDSEGILYNKDKTVLYLYPNGKIGAFIIPNSVKSIGYHAFYASNFSITSVTIPNSVTAIGDEAFGGCFKMTDVTVKWTKPLSVPDNIFTSVNTSACTLHVPTGTKSLYRAADVWKDFETIDDGTPDYTLSVSPDSLNFASSSEQKSFAITSNTEWAVSSNVSWLTVSPVSGANNGTVTVTATANADTSQRTATLTVNGTGVTAQTISITQDGIPTIPVTSVVLNYSAAELIAGETLQLTATVFPSAATNPKVSWSSDKPAVATVSDSGFITAKSAGVANVTVTTEDGNRTATCALTVKDISVEVPDTTTVTQNGKGTIELNLTIPSDATFTGSFEIQFPEGMTLDEQLTVLSLELSGNFTLSFTFEGNNTWLITISSKGLRSFKAVEYRKIMDIAYKVADNVATGSYEATINNLDFMLDNGVSIQEKSLPVPITVSGSGAMTSIDNVGKTSFYASVVHKKIKIESPNKELITIFSANGVLLYSATKNSGSIEVPVSSLRGSVFIIKGSVSGTIKIRL